MDRAIIYLLRYEGLINVVEYLHSIESLLPGIYEEVNRVYDAWGRMTIAVHKSLDG